MSPRRAYRRAAAVVARAHGLPVAQVLHPKGRTARAARMRAVYLTVISGVSARAVARHCAVPWTTVRRHLRLVEDARDNPDIDRRLSTLEERLA